MTKSEVFELAKKWRNFHEQSKFDAAYMVQRAIIEEFKNNFELHTSDHILEILTYCSKTPCVICENGFIIQECSCNDHVNPDHTRQYVVDVDVSLRRVTIREALADFIELLSEE